MKKCPRCGEEKPLEGRIFPAFLPLLWLFGGFSPLGRVCKDCAGLVNFLGILASIGTLIALFIVLVISS